MFEIDETFAVRGVGIVLSGTVTSGLITENKSMVLGPFVDGTFKSLVIRSVHAKVRDAHIFGLARRLVHTVGEHRNVS